MPDINETVISGNSTARIKNYYPETGLVVLYDMNGSFRPGDVVQCQESGDIITLGADFTINDDYDLNYEPTNFDNIGDFISLDDGEIVALDEHFTGRASQEYQTRSVVSL